ncbi:Gfo/Idh/MocA family oxidoreductase [Pseudodesulfovibrio sp.]|nr:Gfo/Idh/MocA family oxidoreductase [Pseudodesulfovibrio sp.]
MINIAQIGCGYWGPNLLRNLDANPGCTVRMVCDQSEERRQYVKQRYSYVDTCDTVDSIFENPDIDAVILATPVALHYDQAIRALKAGKHIMVEKPMARSCKEVEHIAALAREKELVAMAGHTFLYNDAVLYLKDLINSGELGDILYIYSQRLNLGRIRADVDALWNLAPHDISIIQYLLGDPEPASVTRAGMDFMQNGVDDVVFMNIMYPGKAMAHVHVSWLDPNKVRKLTVVGSKKMAVYDDMAAEKITLFDKGIDRVESKMDFDEQDFFAFNHRSGDIVMPKVQFSEPLKIEVEHFLACIRGDEQCRTDANHALNVVRILEMGSEACGGDDA